MAECSTAMAGCYALLMCARLLCARAKCALGASCRLRQPRPQARGEPDDVVLVVRGGEGDA
eukprot:5301607-Pleurochrysis_carterae.AAC.1